MDAALAPADPSASAVGTALPLLVYLTTSGGKARSELDPVLLSVPLHCAPLPRARVPVFARCTLAYLRRAYSGRSMCCDAAKELCSVHILTRRPFGLSEWTHQPAAAARSPRTWSSRGCATRWTA